MLLPRASFWEGEAPAEPERGAPFGGSLALPLIAAGPRYGVQSGNLVVLQRFRVTHFGLRCCRAIWFDADSGAEVSLNGHFLQTASNWQVRQPIYTHSVGRWRHYEPFLQPLKEALEWSPVSRGGCRPQLEGKSGRTITVARDKGIEVAMELSGHKSKGYIGDTFRRVRSNWKRR